MSEHYEFGTITERGVFGTTVFRPDGPHCVETFGFEVYHLEHGFVMISRDGTVTLSRWPFSAEVAVEL